MMHPVTVRTRHAGGAVLKLLLAVLVLGTGYVVYRAYSFYQSTVAPVVTGVSQLAAVAASAAQVAERLNPYTVTKEPADVAKLLGDSFGIAVPAGYTGAFGIDVALLGQRQSQLVALIPASAQPSEIFEGGRNEIRFNPGAHTIFLAATFDRAEPAEMREAIAKVAGGGGDAAALQPVYIEAGGKRVAVLRGDARSYGADTTVVFTFLDDGRLFFATGPKDRFDENALHTALAALVASHPANVLLYEHPKPEVELPPSTDPCGIPRLQDDFDVYVVSVSRGSKPLDVNIDLSGQDVMQEDVVVGKTPRPVVLVLTGNDPIVWNIGRTKDARVAGVLAQGSLRQAVTGLPKSVPLTTYSTADGANACRSFAPQQHVAADPMFKQRVRELFGRGIREFLGQKASGAFQIGEVTGEAAFSQDRTLAAVALPDNVMPGGQKGLDRLVKQQLIRLATEREITDWLAGAARKAGKPLAAYRNDVRWGMGSNRVYWVLQAFDLPEGLAGANARTFIVPPGVAKPGGPQGHNAFLLLEDFQCYGVGCS